MLEGVTVKFLTFVSSQDNANVAGDNAKAGKGVFLIVNPHERYSILPDDLKTTNNVPPETLKSAVFIEKFAVVVNTLLPLDG